jgi:NADH-quinone oxidoreductase subunit A
MIVGVPVLLNPAAWLGFFSVRLCESVHKVESAPEGSTEEWSRAMSTEFTSLFLFILVGVSAAAGMLGMSALLGPKKTTAVKQMPYESGMDPIGDARQRFDVRYYLVAIVFLLFDVELLFLYPWAVAQWSRSAASQVVAVNLSTPATATAPAPAAAAVAGIPPEFRTLVFWEILVFVAILAAAYAYAWRKGVFEWR